MLTLRKTKEARNSIFVLFTHYRALFLNVCVCLVWYVSTYKPVNWKTSKILLREKRTRRQEVLHLGSMRNRSFIRRKSNSLTSISVCYSTFKSPIYLPKWSLVSAISFSDQMSNSHLISSFWKLTCSIIHSRQKVWNM